MALLYKDELQRSHFAPLFSKTSCIYFILVIICIVLPFLLVLRTHSKFDYYFKSFLTLITCLDFWVMDTFHYEQPSVTHLNEMVVIVYTDQETYHAGTTNELNKLLSNSKGVAGMIDV